jgi:hypothetical protein
MTFLLVVALSSSSHASDLPDCGVVRLYAPEPVHQTAIELQMAAGMSPGRSVPCWEECVDIAFEAKVRWGRVVRVKVLEGDVPDYQAEALRAAYLGLRTKGKGGTIRAWNCRFPPSLEPGWQSGSVSE